MDVTPPPTDSILSRSLNQASSLGVLVDLEAGHKGPDVTNKDAGREELDDADNDCGLLVRFVLGEESSGDGGPATTTDGQEEDDEALSLLELDVADGSVHSFQFTHLVVVFKINYKINRRPRGL